MSDKSKNEKKKQLLKKLLKEEVSPSEKEEMEEKLCKNVEKLIDFILVNYDAHKKGLSDQQTAYLFHKLVSCIDDKLQEFTTRKRPADFSNFEDMIDKLNL